MSFSFLGLMGSAEDSGSFTSLVVPIETPFPAFDTADSICALVFVEFEPGTETVPLVSDDAVTADSTTYGARWSPWNNAEFEALVGSSTDPPTAGPVNPWAASSSVRDTGVDAGTGEVHGVYWSYLCPIFASPDNITITFATAQTYAKAYVYGIQGLVVQPGDENTATLHSYGGWLLSGATWPDTFAETSEPGFFHQLVAHTPTSGTTLNVVIGGSSTTEAVIPTQDGTAEAGLTWSVVPAVESSVEVEWDSATSGGDTAESEIEEIGDPTVAVPDALSITISTSSTYMGSFTRWVVTIVDSAGIPANTTNHLATALWRILEAPGGGGGFDGTWSRQTSDLMANGQYVVQNPIDGGYYVDVPEGATYSLRGVMYDGFFSNEVTVELGSPLGGAPFFHAHYAGV